jgi:uncharacterized repeat protein (TIGR01451 family)
VKGFTHFLTLGLVMVSLGVVCPRAEAQRFGLSVVPSANPILLNDSLTYLITVTNIGVGPVDAVVTNILPVPSQFVGATNYYQIFNTTTNSNSVIFGLGSLGSGNIAQMTVTVLPTTVGSITDTVTVASTVFGDTNFVSTKVVVQVTNVVVQADLGVAVSGPNLPVITNDLMTYGLTVINLGPNDAPGVILTNTLPTGVLFKGIFPAGQPFTTAGSNMFFNFGTLTAGSFTNLVLVVEPTNAGALPFSASVGAPGVTDTNTANNFFTTNISVTNYLSGPLGVTTNSSQTFNPQNGMMEQFVTVTNDSGGATASVRVVVTGLTNQLVNAVGTNTGNPFVYYLAPLAAGQTASLLLQYYNPARSPFAFSNAQLNAFAVPPVIFSAPKPAGVSTNLNISRIVQLANGNMLIEWPSIPGRIYTVVYSDSASFSNAMIAPPSFTAPANRFQWIDYGPPTTVSVPTNAARLYRVYQNP